MIGGISKMLTQTLRELAEHGLVERRTLATVPPGTEYSLTDLGRSLLEAVHALAKWAEENTGSLLDASA